MSQDYCRGCGTILQTLEPAEPGYIPETVLLQKKQLICQRCFKIKHYGEAGAIQPGDSVIKQNINKAINFSELLVLVIDFTDITGTLPVWKSFLNNKPYIMVVNKIDLLPQRTKLVEVVAYIKAYLQQLELKEPLDILTVSSLKGTGIEILNRKVQKITNRGSKIALLGATNVGKSSLIKQILTKEGSANTPTVSKYPGTTLGLSNWSIWEGRNTLVDTPGLSPGDRMGDFLCSKCGSILAANNIKQKLWGVNPGKGIILGGLCGVENLSEQEITLIAFAAADVNSHRTDATKLLEHLETQPDWLGKLCKECRKKLNWVEQTVRLEPNQDLAVAGLGWISLRGAAAELRLYLPEGIRWEIRSALIGKR